MDELVERFEDDQCGDGALPDPESRDDSEVSEEIIPSDTVRKRACHFSGVEKMTDVVEEVKKKNPEMAFPSLTHQVWLSPGHSGYLTKVLGRTHFITVWIFLHKTHKLVQFNFDFKYCSFAPH